MFTATKIKVLAIGGVAALLVILVAVHYLDQVEARQHAQQLETKAYNSWMAPPKHKIKHSGYGGFRGKFSKP